MKKTCIILAVINVILLCYVIYYHSTNKVKYSDLYIKSIYSAAADYERGTPIDRRYIDDFLEQHKEYITGHVLEMADHNYTDKYGHEVTQIDVLDLNKECEDATFIEDLQNTAALPANKFDCYILTQTLQFPYDLKATFKSINKMLKKGGAVIITVPVLSRMSNEPDLYEESWRFTEYSLKRLLEDADFEIKDIRSYGNVYAGILFIEGLTVEDAKNPEDLDILDEKCPILVAAVAVKK